MNNRPHSRTIDTPANPENRRGGVQQDGGSARVAVLLVAAALVVTLWVFVAAPLILNQVPGSTVRWERMSFIAQVLAAAVAVFTVGTLAAAVATVWFQAREGRNARFHAIRSEHRELMAMAMRDRRLHTVWGEPADPALPSDDANAQTYAAMLVNFWRMCFRTDGIGEAEVRSAACTFLTGRIGRAFWAGARDARASVSRNRKERRFHQIFEEEYAKAVRVPHVPDAPLPPDPIVARTGTEEECTTAVHVPAAPDGPLASARAGRPAPDRRAGPPGSAERHSEPGEAGRRGRALAAVAGLAAAGAAGYALGRRRGR